MRLDPQEMSSVLQRAEAIQEQRALSLQNDVGAEAMIEAAVEAGLSREAITQALQERLNAHAQHQVGDLIFAPSTDGYRYPARLVSVDGEMANVHFLNGSELRVRRSEIEPFALPPGSVVNADWPHWGRWNCKVIAVDKIALTVRLTDGWGEEETIPISGVRLKVPSADGSMRSRVEWLSLQAAIALGSGIVGALITYSVMR